MTAALGLPEVGTLISLFPELKVRAGSHTDVCACTHTHAHSYTTHVLHISNITYVIDITSIAHSSTVTNHEILGCAQSCCHDDDLS